MKKLQEPKFRLLLALSITLMAFSSHAQNLADISEFLRAEKKDASSLIKSYVTPAINAVSNGMTSGWYTTGKAHKTLGFDLGVSVSAVFTPSSDEYFTPSLSSSTTFSNKTNPSLGAPSVVGPKDVTE
ncbi:MAG: hypothetical protein IM575_03130, partial [Cytophagales bacterium]|nr:hypothetical protein [Cytophagales bacterium]